MCQPRFLRYEIGLKAFCEILPGTAGWDLSKRGLNETVLRRRGDLWLMHSCIGPFLVLLHVQVPGAVPSEALSISW